MPMSCVKARQYEDLDDPYDPETAQRDKNEGDTTAGTTMSNLEASQDGSKRAFPRVNLHLLVGVGFGILSLAFVVILFVLMI